MTGLLSNTTRSELCFQRVEQPHKKMILRWFKEEHVKEFFYGDGVVLVQP